MPFKPRGTGIPDARYQTVKMNCDALKVIQIGLTFLDEDGSPPPHGVPCTWQFNFKFDLEKDMYCSNSIEFLKKSGIQFDQLEMFGIEHDVFSEKLMTSGLVSSESIVRWICFHGLETKEILLKTSLIFICYSDSDFGYLFRIGTGRYLPYSEIQFYSMLKVMFPNLLDLKVCSIISIVNLASGKNTLIILFYLILSSTSQCIARA